MDFNPPSPALARVFATVCLLALLLLGNTNTAEAQNAAVSSDNTQFEPSDADFTVNCQVPPLQNRQDNAFDPSDDMCINVNDDLLQDGDAIQRLAQAYAPYLYFHPSEQYTMSSIEHTFDDPELGQIYQTNFPDEDTLYSDMLTPELLLQTVNEEDARGSSFFFTHNFTYDIYGNGTLNETYYYLPGDGYIQLEEAIRDPNDETVILVPEGVRVSRAPLYYNVYDSGNGTLTFNYHMYYVYNGPVGVGILTGIDSALSYTTPELLEDNIPLGLGNQLISLIPASLAPYGTHEGDWESMSVHVCSHADPSQPLALTYRQRNSGQVLDCTAGECTFHRDSSTNPVGFVALDSHSVYPFSARDVPYVQLPINELYINLEDVIFSDRTAYLDSNNITYAYWGPNETNVLRIPDLEDIPDNVADELDYVWAYEGHWGLVSDDISAVSNSTIPICYSSGINTAVCPGVGDSTMFDRIVDLLGLTKVDYKAVLGENVTNSELLGFDAAEILEELELLVNRSGRAGVIARALEKSSDIVNFFRDYFENAGSVAPRGPATSQFYERLIFPGNPQIWDLLSKNIDENTTAEDAAGEFCERLERPPFPAPLGLEVDILPLISNIVFIVIFCILLTILNAIFFCGMWRDKKIEPIISGDPKTGRYMKPSYKWNNYMFVHSWTYTIALIFCAVGFVMFAIGWLGTQDLIEESVPQLDANKAEKYFTAFALFVMAIDVTFLVAIWLRTMEAWRVVNVKYCDIVGEEVHIIYNEKWWYNGNVVDNIFLISYCGLLVSVVLAVFLVFAAIFQSGMGYGMGLTCDGLSSVLTQWCQQLQWLGVPLPCHEIETVTDWCNEFNQREMILSLWGGFIVLLSHFYMISSGAMAILNNQSLERALLQYPSHEEYLQVLEKIDELERQRKLNGELDNPGEHKANFFQKMYFVGAGGLAAAKNSVMRSQKNSPQGQDEANVVDVDEKEKAPEESAAVQDEPVHDE